MGFERSRQLSGSKYYSNNDLSSTIEEMSGLNQEYENFCKSIEYHFNYVERPENEFFNEFHDEVVELSDKAERLFFPFKVLDGKLYLVHSPNMKVLILLGLLRKEMKDKEGIYEQKL